MTELESIGQYLRGLREQKKLSLEDVEQATKIRLHNLRAIESDQIAERVAAPYARGFLKTYAEFLGADGAAVVERFRVLHEEVSPEPEAPVPEADSPGRGLPLSREMLLVPIIGIGILLLTLIVYFCHSALSRPCEVTVRAIGRVPVKVYRDGTFIGASTIKAGETESWQAKKSIQLKIALPENAEVIYRGRRVVLPGGGPVSVLFERRSGKGRIISGTKRSPRSGT